MIRKPLGTPRPTMRIPKLRPAARPGWYKQFKQLASIAGKQFKVKP
ncbi:MAG: hypothetical protein IKZ92_03370 [Muribaculaceae bacterium]|nr:hypothetical protein [Muribaculaceae bacterium]